MKHTLGSIKEILLKESFTWKYINISYRGLGSYITESCNCFHLLISLLAIFFIWAELHRVLNSTVFWAVISTVTSGLLRVFYLELPTLKFPQTGIPVLISAYAPLPMVSPVVWRAVPPFSKHATSELCETHNKIHTARYMGTKTGFKQ